MSAPRRASACRRNPRARRAAPALVHVAAAALALLALLGPACTAQIDRTGTGTGDATPSAEPDRPPSAFQASLNRLGVPLDLPARRKAIVVNIPAFELVAFRDGMPELRSRVIVGSPRNPTPVLATHVSTVRFRPRWRPTPAMVASGEYPDRVWPPGPRNPLGLAAIRLGAGLLIYLHDTNQRGLFEREGRALSHGCIRVQRWDELVAWVLDIELDEVHRHAKGRRTFDVEAAPIPVLIGYFLRFPDDTGAARTYADVYGIGRSLGPQQPGDAAGTRAPTCAEG